MYARVHCSVRYLFTQSIMITSYYNDFVLMYHRRVHYNQTIVASFSATQTVSLPLNEVKCYGSPHQADTLALYTGEEKIYLPNKTLQQHNYTS